MGQYCNEAGAEEQPQPNCGHATDSFKFTDPQKIETKKMKNQRENLKVIMTHFSSLRIREISSEKECDSLLYRFSYLVSSTNEPKVGKITFVVVHSNVKIDLLKTSKEFFFCYATLGPIKNFSNAEGQNLLLTICI